MQGIARMSIAWIWSGKSAQFKNDAEYVAARSITLGETALQSGDLIDNTAVSVRRLRQLHDQRYVALKDRWVAYWSEKQDVEAEQDVLSSSKTLDEHVQVNISPTLEQIPETELSKLDKAPADTSDDVAVAEPTPVVQHEIKAAEPVKATAQHEGQGKWAVMIGDVKVADGLSKKDAAAQADELNK
jgi:hypothetical protein